MDRGLGLVTYEVAKTSLLCKWIVKAMQEFHNIRRGGTQHRHLRNK